MNRPRLCLAIALIATGLVPRLICAQNRQPAMGTEADVLPPQILSIAGVGAKVQVAQHCSRSLKMRNTVLRTFVADPRVAEVVQFGPDELAFICLAQGTTTVTLWLESDSEPLIILIEGVSAPATYDDSSTGRPGAIAQPLVKLRPRVAPDGDRPPQIPDKPAIPVEARAGGLRSIQPLASDVQRARYDGHAPWPATDRAALSDAGRRQFSPSGSGLR
jgi:hypothetical protein